MIATRETAECGSDSKVKGFTLLGRKAIKFHTLESTMVVMSPYRDRLKKWYMVARNAFLLLLDFSAWPCLGPA